MAFAKPKNRAFEKKQKKGYLTGKKTGLSNETNRNKGFEKKQKRALFSLNRALEEKNGGFGGKFPDRALDETNRFRGFRRKTKKDISEKKQGFRRKHAV